MKIKGEKNMNYKLRMPTRHMINFNFELLDVIIFLKKYTF